VNFTHRINYSGMNAEVSARSTAPLAAAEALLLVAEHGGPTMLARIGVMKALNRHHVREFKPDRKLHHWGKRKLKRYT
jgi:hypothetical protein